MWLMYTDVHRTKASQIRARPRRRWSSVLSHFWLAVAHLTTAVTDYLDRHRHTHMHGKNVADVATNMYVHAMA